MEQVSPDWSKRCIAVGENIGEDDLEETFGTFCVSQVFWRKDESPSGNKLHVDHT